MEEDKILMPEHLTAENGAKALMIGEFFEEFITVCPNCDADCIELETDRCGTCSDTGEIAIKIPVSWTTIKAIYDMAVEYFKDEARG